MDTAQVWSDWTSDNSEARALFGTSNHSLATNDQRVAKQAGNLETLLGTWLGLALQELQDITGGNSLTSIQYNVINTSVEQLVKAPPQAQETEVENQEWIWRRFCELMSSEQDLKYRPR